MKKILILLVALWVVSLAGCNGCRNDWKHLESNFVGMDRRVTLYDANGKVIKEWVTDSTIECEGGSMSFLDGKGRSVKAGGTYIVEETE